MVDPNHPDRDFAAALAGACTFSNEELPTPLPAEPFGILTEWLALAAASKTQPNPNAMTLATVGPDGAPAARIVLARAVDPAAGTITFYTNYTSDKGREITASPRVALCFHWDHLDRQARVNGLVIRVPAAESDAYFNARPVLSRVAAWASDQSQPLASREALLEKNAAAEKRFGIAPGSVPKEMHVPRPPHWGGYRVYATSVELWRGHSARLHDRAIWTRTLTPAVVAGEQAFTGSAWAATRLQP